MSEKKKQYRLTYSWIIEVREGFPVSKKFDGIVDVAGLRKHTEDLDYNSHTCHDLRFNVEELNF